MDLERDIEELKDQVELLEFELQDTVNSFNTLIEVLVGITSAEDVKGLFEVVLSILGEHFEFRQGLFTQPVDQHFEVIASKGFPEGSEFKRSARAPDAISWCVHDINSFMLIKNIATDACFNSKEFFEGQEEASVIAITLDQSEASGVFVFYLDLMPQNSLQAISHNIDSLLSVLGPYLGNFVQRLNAEKERQVIQSQLIQSAKLASLGQMSAGIAHELNNPLFAIMAFAQNIQKKPHGEKVPIYLEKIVTATDRMSKIIKHLKRFTRKSDESTETQMQSIDLHLRINEAIIMFSHALTQDSVEVVLELTTDPNTMISGDAIQLESVFQNLISNSKDAFNEKEIAERKIWISTEIDGDKIVMRHRDNAGGMPQKVVDRIFDPFFTTKEAGKGTGLGMNISYEIIKQHDAKVVINSVEGEGTTFEITFQRGTEAEVGPEAE
jgi:signal transduction histidine kinase